MISLLAVNILVPWRSKTWVPIQFKISLFRRSLLAIEIAAVKNLVNHQYIFSANPWRSRKAPVMVPKIVRPAAIVVTSSLSHAAKNSRKKVKPGVELSSKRWRAARARSMRLLIGEETILRCGWWWAWGFLQRHWGFEIYIYKTFQAIMVLLSFYRCMITEILLVVNFMSFGEYLPKSKKSFVVLIYERCKRPGCIISGGKRLPTT